MEYLKMNEKEYSLKSCP